MVQLRKYRGRANPLGLLRVENGADVPQEAHAQGLCGVALPARKQLDGGITRAFGPLTARRVGDGEQRLYDV